MLPEDEEKVRTAQEAGVLETNEELEALVEPVLRSPDDAIPIPEAVGKRFKELYEKRCQALQPLWDEWEMARKQYFVNGYLLQGDSKELSFDGDTKENFVRTTVLTLLDFAYTKNPDAELSAVQEESKPLADLLTKALTALINKRSSPGINLHPNYQRMIIQSELTNLGAIKLDFQPQTGSLEQAMQAFLAIQEEIKKEEDQERLEVLYSLLDAVYSRMQATSTFGLSVRTLRPDQIILSKDCKNSDLSNCPWAMIRDTMKDAAIEAEYLTKIENEDGEQSLRYKYKPSVVYAGKQAQDTEDLRYRIINDLIPDGSEDLLGEAPTDETPVIWVYDRIVKKRYLYVEGHWDVPLWVFDDTLKLSRFYDFVVLSFSTGLDSVYQPGEVNYYLPFQLMINAIRKQADRVRGAAFNTIIYNANAIDKQEVEKVLGEVNKPSNAMRAIGVKLRDMDKTLGDVMSAFELPVAKFTEIFDTRILEKALERTSRVSAALRGDQFTANTTNDAVETYNSSAESRIEGLVDAIENTSEQLYWAMCEIMVSQFDVPTMQKLVGADAAQAFQPMPVEKFNTEFSMTIAAGSSQKPTSRNKKEEATNIIQMLGQFGSTAPGTVLSIVTRLMRHTFGRWLVTDKDLKMLQDESQAFLQKGVSTTGEKNG